MAAFEAPPTGGIWAPADIPTDPAGRAVERGLPRLNYIQQGDRVRQPSDAYWLFFVQAETLAATFGLGRPARKRASGQIGIDNFTLWVIILLTRSRGAAILLMRASIMDVQFADDGLRRLYTDSNFNGGYSTAIIRAFRKKMQLLVSAKDERDLRAWNSLHFKQLKGSRKHQFSIRVNGPWRLVLEKRDNKGRATLVIVAMENDH